MERELLDQRIVGRYVLQAALGQGGMGTVYLAFDEVLRRPVALKVMAPNRVLNAEFRTRFQREIGFACRIEHPNVVPVYDGGIDDGRLFLVMRYVDGNTLAGLIPPEGMQLDRAIALAEQISLALQHVHACGLIHRDVKPLNVLVAKVGFEHAMLTDFGIARELVASSNLTANPIGSAHYMAPEALRGEALTTAADQYSLACLLFEVLAGRPPYAGPAPQIAHLEAPVPDLEKIRSDLPRAVAESLRRALSKRCDDRFPSIDAFFDAFSSADSPAAVGPTTPHDRSIASGRTSALLATARLLEDELDDRDGAFVVYAAAGRLRSQEAAYAAARLARQRFARLSWLRRALVLAQEDRELRTPALFEYVDAWLDFMPAGIAFDALHRLEALADIVDAQGPAARAERLFLLGCLRLRRYEDADLDYELDDPSVNVRHELDAATQALQAAVDLGLAEAFVPLGEALSNAGRDPEALAAWLEGARRGDPDASGQAGLALASGGPADRSRAAELLRHADEHGVAGAALGLGRLAREGGDPEAARAAFERERSRHETDEQGGYEWERHEAEAEIEALGSSA